MGAKRAERIRKKALELVDYLAANKGDQRASHETVFLGIRAAAGVGAYLPKQYL